MYIYTLYIYSMRCEMSKNTILCYGHITVMLRLSYGLST